MKLKNIEAVQIPEEVSDEELMEILSGLKYLTMNEALYWHEQLLGLVDGCSVTKSVEYRLVLVSMIMRARGITRRNYLRLYAKENSLVIQRYILQALLSRRMLRFRALNKIRALTRDSDQLSMIDAVFAEKRRKGQLPWRKKQCIKPIIQDQDHELYPSWV